MGSWRQDLSILFTETACLMADEAVQTSISGVFAVGDVLCNHTKQEMISSARGENG
jgi:thioredoxin reductase (NADPH)